MYPFIYSMTKRFIQYKDEVLGKRVEILFHVNVGQPAFFVGTIERVSIERIKTDGSLKIEHFIEFDDGDELLFNLNHEENEFQLRWPDEDSPPAASSSISSIIPPITKKRKLIEEEQKSEDPDPQRGIQQITNKPMTKSSEDRLQSQGQPSERSPLNKGGNGVMETAP